MTKILVIEDDPTVRTLITKLLKAEGFDVISGTNGQTGIQLAQAHDPDLIICDIMMPEFDGYEVLVQLRQNPITARIPFIFLSAKADRTDLRQGMELGADDYLTKPFKRTELLGAIAARLEKHTAITQPYIDEMRRAAQNLNQLAYRDPLTNLANRIAFHHTLQEALKAQQMVAVLCVNLDGFKAINSHLGYLAGDLLLQAVADRLSHGFSKHCAIARLGSDEFSLLLSDVANQRQVVEVVQQMLHTLSEPYDLDGQWVQVQARIGIALYPNDGDSPDGLLNQAHTATRYIKTQRGNRYQFYTLEMDLLEAERQLVHNRLNTALDHQQFQIHYQPQVNLVSGRIIGAEALLRWFEPELGWISPARFIPIAEETGLIVSIGQWVLKTACAQAKQWHTRNGMPLRISVNLSARQFRQQNFVEMVAEVLQQTELDPDLLVLELTETCVMEDVETTIVTLKQLQSMGVHISVDDFGTGYSSLNYLKRFPINTLKIDQSFIQDIMVDTNDAAIAKAIIAMAQSLQLKVIAEGVETAEQLAFLRQNGCYAMQGFFFSQPIPGEDFEQLLLADKRL
ncbi:EAL domain-containing protein [Leptolyngbya sp. FACHB-36]|uniref:two-component system response regulator n=1 Tax=Leptolyngbya sp. FACHB-36 TaxID=2692808 RepID=UPI0016818D94|nr:GGDEF domain-containing response regulator [Leptolyngbya sp. FACHB-36]MBD2021313.1 EAL domain-containing protein [Leptolyngbya sp. FACHB-36]